MWARVALEKQTTHLPAHNYTIREFNNRRIALANNCSKKERICIHCGSKYMPNSNRQKYCANCKSFQQSNFWRTHKEQRKELDKKRYMKNRYKILEKHKIWSKNNRERLRQYDS